MSKHFDARVDSSLLKRATRAFVEVLLDETIPELRLAARGCGYALAIHGSLARDIDIIAIPWEQQADDPELLFERLLGVLAGKFGRAARSGDWVDKAHGRRAAMIYLPGMCPEIDFSVMPRMKNADKKDEQ